MTGGDFYLSRAAVRELDRRAIDDFGVPGVVLMENAGRGCAELLMRLNPEKRRVMVLSGPGNNGGDGFVIARHLDNHGWPVYVWCLFEPGKPLSGDAAVNYRIAARSEGLLRDAWGTPFPTRECIDDLLLKWGFVVDALFGTGLTRPLGPPYDQVLTCVNAGNNPVLAVDIPSGLDCDTGEPLGPTVRATHTATFVAPKLGFRNPAARAWTGEVHVIDIGAPRVLIEEYKHRWASGGV